MDRGTTRHGVLNELAQHILGRSLDTKPVETRSARHDGPIIYTHDTNDIRPTQHNPLDIYTRRLARGTYTPTGLTHQKANPLVESQ
jgi:hypothetical protein